MFYFRDFVVFSSVFQKTLSILSYLCITSEFNLALTCIDLCNKKLRWPLYDDGVVFILITINFPPVSLYS